MLTIKAPIELKCGRITASSQEAFGERIRGNYELLAARIEREDLLHVVMAPPEVYIGGGEMTSLVEDTRIQNVRETKLTVINNLLNRIAVTEDVKLSYQDRVYITDVLQRLGVTDVSEFMQQVFELKQESWNTEELTELYWNHMEELQSTVEQYVGQPGVNRSVTEYAGRENTLHLHEEILSRLKTGAVYQILSNFYTSRTGAQYVSAQELNFAEQQRTVSRILLNRLETEATGTPVPFVYRHENYYEENYQEGEQATEETVNAQLTSAVLLNLADSLIENLSVRREQGADIWLDLTNSLYKTAENTLQRMIYRAQTERVHFRKRRGAGSEVLRTQELKITALQELLGFAERAEEIPGAGAALPQEGQALPEEGMRPVDIRHAEAAAEEGEDGMSSGVQTERTIEQIISRTERLEREERSRETTIERLTEQTEAGTGAQAGAQSEGREAAPERPRRRGRRRSSEAPPQESGEAPAPLELKLLSESGADNGSEEESPSSKAEESREEEPPGARITETLNQYFSLLYAQSEQTQESLPPAEIAYPDREEAAAEEPQSRLRTERLPEGGGRSGDRSVLERWQTPEEKTSAEQAAQPGRVIPGREMLVYPEGETFPESEAERELIRERLLKAAEEGDVYHQIYQEAAELTHPPAAGTAAEEEPGMPPESEEERLERDLLEIDRRNVENYERYQQLLKSIQEQKAEKKPEERPSPQRMRQESLRALEHPQEALEEHQKRVQESEEAVSRADQVFLDMLPEETRQLYRRLEEMQQSRRSAGQRGEMEQSRDVSRLTRDIQLIERESETATRERQESLREVSETSRTLLEQSREYTGEVARAGSRTEESHQELSLVHKSTENTLDEETLQEILAQERTRNRRTEVVRQTEEDHRVENTQVVNRSGQSSVTRQQDLEELIERGLQRQMSQLSDQVYTKLERRLENEKKRRGY
ncbi:MAG: hypothetical protein LUE24_05970 [Lachnospiraceae bacterium]|nr:hypothetical protein [Lachnospiraceae bacterium]